MDQTPSDLSTVSTGPSPALLEAVAKARSYADQATAPNTLRAYHSGWRHFAAWCEEHRRATLPDSPESVTVWLLALIGLGIKPATLQRRLSVIS